jgi:hypothetical protein
VRVIREADIDVDEIRALPKEELWKAMAGINIAILALFPLRNSPVYPEGCSPEVIRALYVAEDALREALGD